MDRAVPTLPATMTVTERSEEIAHGDSPLTHGQGTPIVDEEGGVVGILTRTDLLRAVEDNPDGKRTVLEAGSRDLIVAYPDESLGTAVARMLKNDIGRLVIVSRQDPRRLLGYIGRSGVLTVRLLRFQEEQAREPGWFARRLSSEISNQPT